MANEIQVWNKVMSAALNIPGVKVDRYRFLAAELSQYCGKGELDKAINNPVDVISEDQITRLANACINNHLLKVTGLSFAAGIPGGLAMAATIPGDMAQYYWHTFVLAQKLAYLYGIPDLCDEDGNLTETSQDMLTLFVGVMMGAAVANNAITKLSKAFATQVVKRLPQKALTKTVYYPIIKQIAKWLGVNLTKGTFAKGVGKAIPVLGGFISGGLTAVTFKPAAKRLQDKLAAQMYDIRNFADVKDAFVATEVDLESEDEGDSFVEPVSPVKIVLLFLINLARIGNNMSDGKETFLSDAIETSGLSEDEQLELAEAMAKPEQIKIDFTALENDSATAAILLQKGAELLKLEGKVTLAEKLYFKKIAKQLGFTSENIEDALK